MGDRRGAVAAEEQRGDEDARLVDLAGGGEGGGEGRAALQQEAGEAAAAELGERRVTRSAGSRRRRRWSRRRRRAALRRGRGSASGRWTTGTGRFVEGRQELGVERQAGVGVEDDADRLARFAEAGGQQGVVGEDGADADRDRVGFGAPAVHQGAALIAGDPGRLARRRSRSAPSSDIASFSTTSGRPVRACLRKGWLSSRAARGLGPGREADLDPAVAQDPRAAAGCLLARVLGGDHDAPDPRLEDRVDAGRLAPLVRAGLERHVHRRPGRILAPRAASSSAARSACRPPSSAWKPSPIISPSRTTTAPTSGFGLTRPRPPSASASALAEQLDQLSGLGVHKTD